MSEALAIATIIVVIDSYSIQLDIFDVTLHSIHATYAPRIPFSFSFLTS